jgi:hypothetical protein
LESWPVNPLDVVAKLFTVTECVPAVAVFEAEVSSRTLVFELEPVFWARIPLKSVNWLRSLERVEYTDPRLEIAASWLCSEESWFFHGVSTF